MQAILAKVFEFSAEDIAINRKGELSASQRERITSTHYANSRLAWWAFAIIFGVGFLGFSADMIRTNSMGVKPLLIYLGVTAFFGLIIGVFILYYRIQLEQTLHEGNVQQIEGQVRLIMERGEKTMNRYFCVGNHRFLMERYAHYVLLQESGIVGREAIVYVSAPWRGILSVELQG